jgi:Sushi repeat (SCR repeat)
LFFAVEIVNISRIFEKETRNTKDFRSGCQIINNTNFYKFQIEKERRLHSIRLRTTSADWQYFERAVFTFEGWNNDQSKWKKLNIHRANREHDFSANLVLNKYSIYRYKTLSFTFNIWVVICEIRLFAYHEECGRPEIPLHGHVQLESDDTKAIYWCDDGYQLKPNYPIRHCIQGRWNGSQPICTNLA